jgi:hypothetical protein
MRRLFSIGILVSLIAAMSATPAVARTLTANISPSTQSHPHNVSSSWTGSWAGYASYHVEFWYGDGMVTTTDLTNSTSRSYTHMFAPCPGEPTAYTQTLRVWDNWPGPGLYVYRYSTSHEAAGAPC